MMKSPMQSIPFAERTMAHVLLAKARKNDDKPFLIFEGQTFSYKEAAQLSQRLAANLLALGIAPGDHVSVIMGNHPNIAWTLFALGLLGAVAVPVNTAAKGEQLRYFLDQSDSKFLIADEEFVERVLVFAERLPKLRGIIVHRENGIAEQKESPWPWTDFARLMEKDRCV